MVADLYPHRPESYSWPMEGVHCLPHQHSLLPMEDGRYRVAVPPSGFLKTSTVIESGIAKDEYYYYSVYYCSQAANQLGDKYWLQIYPPLRDTLLRHQRPDGSFPPGQGGEQAAGPAYATAMATLALCVPYHYLPLYQK